MKEMQKARIMSRRSLNSVMSERQFLTQLRHPFIVNMMYAFQDIENIYLVSNLMTGGDLRYHIGKRVNFTQEQTRFIIACLTMALQYIHQNNIIHRDIKPENLVFDASGYIKVTDFGIAKVYQRENSHETSGTPSYMAPEVIFKQNHSYESDFYAMGVICHELLLNKRPYKGRTRKELKEQMLHKKIKLRSAQCPPGWDVSIVDFINQCLQRKPCKRLGYNGAAEIMQHPWLKNFDWQELLSEKMKAPYVPNGGADNFDEQHANHERTLGATEQEEIQSKKLLLRRDSIQHLFNGYYYDYQQESKAKDSKRQKSESTTGQTQKSTKSTETKASNFLSIMTHPNLPKLKPFKQKPAPKAPQDKLEQVKKSNSAVDQSVSAEDAPLLKPVVANSRLTSDIKKIEKEEINNIIGASNRLKSKNSFSPSQKAKDTTSVQDRYQINKLKDLIEEQQMMSSEQRKQNKESEPDNDKFHQLYDQ